MWTWIVGFQREIYLEFAGHIRAVAETGGWSAFLAFLPMGILFGAVHAMTPGHSKTLLATYLAGSSSGIGKAFATSLALSVTHVTMSVLIVLLSLPLVEVMFGGSGPGSSPLLEGFSRGLLGVIGLWMIWRAVRNEAHSHGRREGVMVGFMAGLIPCPLTLFVMNFAVLHKVVTTGILFAVAMMIGIALTLGFVAIITVFFRERLALVMERRPGMLEGMSRILELLAGLVLVAIAAVEVLR